MSKFADEVRRLRSDDTVTNYQLLAQLCWHNAERIAALVEAASDPVSKEDRSLYIWQIQQAIAALEWGDK